MIRQAKFDGATPVRPPNGEEATSTPHMHDRFPFPGHFLARLFSYRRLRWEPPWLQSSEGPGR